MPECIYKVQWILNLDDPDRAGLYGTTSHAGVSPAAAAIASAETVSHAVEDDWGRAQLLILRVSEESGEENLLSGNDLQTALRYASANLPIDVVYRPLC